MAIIDGFDVAVVNEHTNLLMPDPCTDLLDRILAIRIICLGDRVAPEKRFPDRLPPQSARGSILGGIKPCKLAIQVYCR